MAFWLQMHQKPFSADPLGELRTLPQSDGEGTPFPIPLLLDTYGASVLAYSATAAPHITKTSPEFLGRRLAFQGRSMSSENDMDRSGNCDLLMIPMGVSW